MALLGEMYFKSHGPYSWYNLPREGGIAYAPQESWVLNRTIKVWNDRALLNLDLNKALFQDNILFGEPFDEERYKKGIHI